MLLSEIIPKTIGANYWRELAGFTVKSLNIIIKLLAPLVFISQIVTRLLKKDKETSILNRADFMAMADLGEQEGVLDAGESSIMRNLMDFESILSRNIMTPRTVVEAASEESTVRELYDRLPHLRFSRIPVFDGSLDHVTGYVLRFEMLNHLVKGSDDTLLKELRRDIIAVQEDFPVPRLFERFTEKNEQIALVVDDFGGTAGLVSMEDVIETLLGLEIVDESDGSTDMQALAREKWEERAARVGLLEPLDKKISEHADASESIDARAGGTPGTVTRTVAPESQPGQRIPDTDAPPESDLDR